MSKNIILDYEQVNEKLDEIANNSIIKEVENLSMTEHGLPIRNFIVGDGEADIVITGATHGQEIISTDFVIKLMEDINANQNEWSSILKEFKIHIIPMLNPEGYLISTSAVRQLIPRDMESDEAEAICKKYFEAYKADALNEPKTPIKEHQEMFNGIDYNCIPDKYSDIKKSVKNIFEKYPDLPKWCVHTWSANGNGIDVQANCEYNPNIDRINNDEHFYMSQTRFDNIDYSHPGPINCPFDKEKGFKLENETIAITNLLEELDKENRLYAYLNYHGTGAIIYQRPAIDSEKLDFSKEEVSRKEIENYLLSKAYSDLTEKRNANDKKYRIVTRGFTTSSTNDIFRLKYQQDLLIELSEMIGNPIAPYGDLEGNYKKTINSNMDAVKYSLKVASLAQIVSKFLYEKIETLSDKDDYLRKASLVDLVYEEFRKKVCALDNTLIKNKDDEEKEEEI